MEIADVKAILEELEESIEQNTVSEFAELEIDGKVLVVYLAKDLKKNCQKGKIWKSKPFYITLKNIKYGMDKKQMRSKQGRDGIFLVDRDFRPENSMQTKIYKKYVDKENSSFSEVVKLLDIKKEEKTNIKGVRVVSHHLRLLGFFLEKAEKDILVLFDFDAEK